MSIATPAALLDQAAALRLLDEEQLATARSLVAVDARSLAGELIRRGWLTPFQVNQLFQARGEALLMGSYVLLEKLGEGGMGAVYKARNWKLGRIVALKLIRKDRLNSPDIVRRFHREIQSVSQLDHPNIVRAHDADSVSDTHFLVMEYVEGTDLAQVVKERGPLPVTQACHCIRQAALGLQHAFERGLVHRDIKPSNLLLSGIGDWASGIGKQETLSDPRPSTINVLDFGLARLTSGNEEDGTMTATGVVMGTPDYIAPEQAREAHDVDIRADLYSLGCSLYFLLTGQPPFPKGSLGAKLLKHQMEEPEPVERLRPDIPERVVLVVRKLMAKRPEDRYQTPAELIHALDSALAPVAPAVTVNPFSELDGGKTMPIPSPRRGRPVWLLAPIALALLGGLLLWRPWARDEAEKKRHRETVAVEAKRTWQDTTTDVKAGNMVSVRCQGRWRREGLPLCGSEGIETAPRGRTIVPEAPVLCLLARIGDDPAPLDARRAFEATRSGRLYLQANEVDLSEAEGQLQAEIEGGEAGSEALAAPPLLAIQSAEEKFRPLFRQFQETPASPPRLRDDLLAFAWNHGGLPQAGRAFDLIRRLPSPADRLSATAIPAWERTRGEGQPKELVAILGDTRGRHWAGIDALAFGSKGDLYAADPREGHLS